MFILILMSICVIGAELFMSRLTWKNVNDFAVTAIATQTFFRPCPILLWCLLANIRFREIKVRYRMRGKFLKKGWQWLEAESKNIISSDFLKLINRRMNFSNCLGSVKHFLETISKQSVAMKNYHLPEVSFFSPLPHDVSIWLLLHLFRTQIKLHEILIFRHHNGSTKKTFFEHFDVFPAQDASVTLAAKQQRWAHNTKKKSSFRMT